MSAYKWTSTLQTCVDQRSTVCQLTVIQTYEVCIFIISILLMEKTKAQLVKGHIAGKEYNQNFNSSTLAPKPVLF